MGTPAQELTPAQTERSGMFIHSAVNALSPLFGMDKNVESFLNAEEAKFWIAIINVPVQMVLYGVNKSVYTLLALEGKSGLDQSVLVPSG